MDINLKEFSSDLVEDYCYDSELGRTINETTNLDLLGDKMTSLILPKNAIIGGGCFKNIIMGEKVNDYDLFFLTSDDYVEGVNFYKNNKNFNIVYENENAIRFFDGLNNYELISHIKRDVYDLLNDFDFDCVKIATTTKMVKNITTDEIYVVPDKLYYSNKTLYDIKNKFLTFDKSKTLVAPFSTLKRVVKYVSKGFQINNSDLQYLAQEINLLEQNDLGIEFYYEEKNIINE